MMYAVEHWLSGQRNFYVGKSIYKTLGKDQRLKELLENGKTPIAEDLLLKAMQKLLVKPAVIATAFKVKETEEMPEEKDPVLLGIHNEWKKPYHLMNYKRHELDQYKGNTPEMIGKRKVLAFEILDLEQECMKLWEKRDYYKLHGKLPDVSEMKIDIPTDPMELGKLIESLKKNIRRNRKLMQQQPDKPVYAQKYQEYKDQYHLVTNSHYEEKD